MTLVSQSKVNQTTTRKDCYSRLSPKLTLFTWHIWVGYDSFGVPESLGLGIEWFPRWEAIGGEVSAE